MGMNVMTWTQILALAHATKSNCNPFIMLLLFKAQKYQNLLTGTKKHIIFNQTEVLEWLNSLNEID